MRRRLATFVAALLLSLLAAELLLRWFVLTDGRYGDRPLPPYRAINHPRQAALLEYLSQRWESGHSRDGEVLFDTELGWTMAPSRPGKHGKGSSNALAARGPREYASHPPAGTTRVLTFGDSFTYCNEVDDAATWQAQLERRDRRLEVINFGVPSYGTDQALLRMRRVGRDLGASVIVIGLMLENIGRNVNRYRPTYFPQSGTLGIKPRFVLQNGTLTLLPQPYPNEGAALCAIGNGSVIRDLARDEYWQDRPWVPFGDTFATVRLVAGYAAYRQRRPETLWAAPEQEPCQVTLAILAACVAEARAAGAERAPILIFPTEDALGSLLAERPKFWSWLLQDLDARRIDAIDVSDALAAECRRRRGGAAMVFGGGHLNEIGNEIVARRLGEWLSTR